MSGFANFRVVASTAVTPDCYDIPLYVEDDTFPGAWEVFAQFVRQTELEFVNVRIERIPVPKNFDQIVDDLVAAWNATREVAPALSPGLQDCNDVNCESGMRGSRNEGFDFYCFTCR